MRLLLCIKSHSQSGFQSHSQTNSIELVRVLDLSIQELTVGCVVGVVWLLSAVRSSWMVCEAFSMDSVHQSQ